MSAQANFPKGFSGGLTLQGLPIAMIYSTSQASLGNTGNTGIWWVDNTNGLDGNPGTYQIPLKTLARAVALAKENDIIVLKPGHAETISTATALSLSVANLTVLGIGEGSARPTFTLGTVVGATVNVTAANVTVRNVLFVANFLDIAAAFTTTSAAGLTIDQCEFRDTSAVLNFLAVVKTSTTDGAASGLTLSNSKQISLGTTANTAVLDLRANVDRLTVVNNVIRSLVAGNSALIYQATTTKVLTNVLIDKNSLNFVGADAATGVLLITTATTHTGMISNNFVTGARAVATAVLVTASSGFKFMENFYQSVADKSGILLPANA